MPVPGWRLRTSLAAVDALVLEVGRHADVGHDHLGVRPRWRPRRARRSPRRRRPPRGRPRAPSRARTPSRTRRLSSARNTVIRPLSPTVISDPVGACATRRGAAAPVGVPAPSTHTGCRPRRRRRSSVQSEGTVQPTEPEEEGKVTVGTASTVTAPAAAGAGHRHGDTRRSVGGMKLRFCGVRGSTPAPGPDFVRVGGHTSCLAVWPDGSTLPRLILDAGTGIRAVTPLLGGRPFRGTVLLTHLHWDHVQGLPFFRAGDRDDAVVDLLLPDEGVPAASLLARAMSPPHFPIRPEGLRGTWRFGTVREGWRRWRDSPCWPGRCPTREVVPSVTGWRGRPGRSLTSPTTSRPVEAIKARSGRRHRSGS